MGNMGALTDLISKVCSCSKVRRKPAADWFILSGLSEATEYILYKSKAKDALGHARDYGFVIVCHNKTPADGSTSRGILSVMQRCEYIESMLIYTCLECLLNFELAGDLLIRVQQREHEEKADISRSQHNTLLEMMMELEEELVALAETHGASTAIRRGEGMTSFEIKGPLSETPERLMTPLLSISESLQALLRSIGQALKPQPKPE